MECVVFHPTLPKALLAAAYTRVAQAPAVFGGGPVSFENISDAPLPSEMHVRVRCKLAGICGTDLSLLRFKVSMRSATMARMRSLSRAMPLGHEAVGEVVEAGKEATSLRVGDRVVMIPGNCCAAIGKPPCAMCEEGLPLLCFHRDEAPPQLAEGGAWSTQFVRRESQLLKIPDAISDEAAVLIEPLACAAHAVLRRPPAAGDAVVVIGCGTIGLGIVQALRALGIPLRIIAFARHPHQGELAIRFGADRTIAFANAYDALAAELKTEILSRGNNRMLSRGAARVYDAVGSSETIGHALRWVAPRGAVVVEGINPAPSPRDCSPIWLREIDLLGAHGHGREHFEGRELHTFELVRDWLLQGRIKPETMITHRFPLRAFREAVRVADSRSASGAIKVVMHA